MKKYRIATFKLPDEEKIIIESPYPINEFACCDEIPILFLYGKDHYVLNTDLLREAMSMFAIFLERALANQLPLHESIKQDIGFLWNEELQEKPGLVYEKFNDRNYWVGQSHLLWDTPSTVKPETTTWLYNDNNGSIVLEITPTYPWHFVKPKKREIKIPYEEWMSGYKPFIVRTIPREVAEQWLKQAQELVIILEDKMKSAVEGA